jgi:hypothetical protein
VVAPAALADDIPSSAVLAPALVKKCRREIPDPEEGEEGAEFGMGNVG